MITIKGKTIHWDKLSKKVSVTAEGRQILKQMDKSKKVYSYQSSKELENTVLIRESIIDAAKNLNDSKARFAVFEETKANKMYWAVTDQGGIRKLEGVKSSAAVQDIFNNGAKYAFECATAIIILYYYAALNYLGSEKFNTYFEDLYLYSWEADSDLGIQNTKVKEPIPGDIVYFNNPDYVKPQWRGENSVFLGDNLYYGHGMGILSKNDMIEQLNRLGESNEEDAHMLDKIVRPSFDHWYKLKKENVRSSRAINNQGVLENVRHHNLTSISYYYYYSLIRKFNNGKIKITITGKPE
ncbi:protein-glutamine gamma-glutamyltransferase [Virgibacillus sp. DJP39]|uniref:protein-glutamine gamma-glutamyltransferase n=1 Tax=Virgibacillus sp. DJP39 TaxID=3409790 RepID=UPI003BB7FC5F